MIRVGVIGCSAIAFRHIEAYRALPGVEVVALCDLNGERARALCTRYSVPGCYTDMHEMLALPGLDAVSVCTWNAAHAQCAVAALRAKKHVLCEKPMARTLQEAEGMLAAARESGRLLMIGMVRRFGADALALGEAIDAGALGDIYYARTSYLRRCGHPGGWFGQRALSGGGPLLDLGVHGLDLCWYMMGRPRPVSAHCVTFSRLGERTGVTPRGAHHALSQAGAPPDIEDMACAVFNFANSASVLCEAGYSANIPRDEQRLQLCGTLGGAEIAPALSLNGVRDNRLFTTEPDAALAFEESFAFGREIACFIRRVQANDTSDTDARDAMALLCMIGAAYRSAASGRVEDVPVSGVSAR